MKALLEEDGSRTPGKGSISALSPVRTPARLKSSLGANEAGFLKLQLPSQYGIRRVSVQLQGALLLLVACAHSCLDEAQLAAVL